LAAAGSLAAQTWKEWLNLGVKAYRNAKYQEAVSYLRRAVGRNASEVAPGLYLGMAYMMQYIPDRRTRTTWRWRRPRKRNCNGS